MEDKKNNYIEKGGNHNQSHYGQNQNQSKSLIPMRQSTHLATTGIQLSNSSSDNYLHPHSISAIVINNNHPCSRDFYDSKLNHHHHKGGKTCSNSNLTEMLSCENLGQTGGLLEEDLQKRGKTNLRIKQKNKTFKTIKN